MNRMMTRFALKYCIVFVLPIALALATATATVSCTRAAPTINYTYMKVVYEQNDAGSTLTGFMFFVTVSDEDGPEDLAELRLYNDNEGLMWVVKSDSWISIEERGRTWVGSKEFRPAGSEALPSGQYRAVIADKSGETGEKTFGFDAPSESPYRFPTFTINDGNYTATSAYPENYLLMFFEDGAYRNVTKLSNMSGTVASLRLPSDVYSVALWADDSAKAVSALTKKIYIRNN